MCCVQIGGSNRALRNVDSGPFRLAPDLAVAKRAKLGLHQQKLAQAAEVFGCWVIYLEVVIFIHFSPNVICSNLLFPAFGAGQSQRGELIP